MNKLEKKIGADGKKAVAINSPNFDTSYLHLRNRYKASGKPIPVDFRKLVSFRSGSERHTHLIHPYPAKLLQNIPYYFINCPTITPENSRILDPFCGSGTVLLEACMHGHTAIGADANPLARLISKVKTTKFDVEKIEESLFVIEKFAKKTKRRSPPQDLLDWGYWYNNHTYEELAALSHAIQSKSSGKEKDFFLLCFSAACRKLSLADPKISVPVKLNPDRYEKSDARHKKIASQIKELSKANAIEAFIKIVIQNIKRFKKLADNTNYGALETILNDARFLAGIRSNSIDLIITSPPYAGAQKYIRSSSLGIGWLTLSPDNTLRSLEKLNIGRENYQKTEIETLVVTNSTSANIVLKKIWKINPLRAHIAGQYLNELEQALKEAHRVLKMNAHMIMVVGNNVVCGHNFNTQKYLNELCSVLGFSIELIMRDDIHSRGLMTKRNKTASVIACEWIMVFKKHDK